MCVPRVDGRPRPDEEGMVGDRGRGERAIPGAMCPSAHGRQLWDPTRAGVASCRPWMWGSRGWGGGGCRVGVCLVKQSAFLHTFVYGESATYLIQPRERQEVKSTESPG